MAFRIGLVAAVSLALSGPVAAEELSAAQQDVWETVSVSHELFLQGKIDESFKYIHKDVVWWNKVTPVPGDYDSAYLLDQAFDTHTGKWLAYDIVPLTVLVFDTFAVVNFYVRGLREETPGGNAILVHQRYHNTWKKEGGRWLLVANYNAED